MIAGAEGLTQRPDERLGVGRIGGGGREVVTAVIQVEGGAALGPEWDASLLGDSKRAVAHGMNPGVEAPAGGAHPLGPAQTEVGHVVQSGP